MKTTFSAHNGSDFSTPSRHTTIVYTSNGDCVPSTFVLLYTNVLVGLDGKRMERAEFDIIVLLRDTPRHLDRCACFRGSVQVTRLCPGCGRCRPGNFGDLESKR